MATEIAPSNIDAVTAKIARKANLLKWGIGLGAAILLGPLIWALASAVLGLAALGAATALAAVVSLAVINFAPVVSLKFQNAKLQAIKAEAAKNPIETMQNTYLEKERELEAKKKQIEAFNAKVIQYATKRAEFSKQFPDDAPRFIEIEQKMRTLLNNRQDKWREASAALELFGKVIVRSQAIWEMAKASAALQESAGDLEANFMQRVRVETALDSVESSLAQSMAQLDTLLMERVDESPRAITHQPADVIDVVPSPAAAKVQR